jgi:hypothetical protein
MCQSEPVAGKRTDRATEQLVSAAADELYGLPLDAFTAARNDRVKHLRADGVPDAAQAVGKLGKPNAVAWLANHLIRGRRDEVAALLELGTSLRAATAALDATQLRALSKRQREDVTALVGQARELSAEAGQPASDATARGLEETLHAALADEDAGAQLVAGRMTTGLSGSGFPGVNLTGAAPTGQVSRRDELAQARKAEAAARDTAKRAEQAWQAARRTLAKAQRAVTDAAAEVDRLKAELDDAARNHDKATARRAALTKRG